MPLRWRRSMSAANVGANQAGGETCTAMRTRLLAGPDEPSESPSVDHIRIWRNPQRFPFFCVHASNILRFILGKGLAHGGETLRLQLHSTRTGRGKIPAGRRARP